VLLADAVLARAFRLPGLRFLPGGVPAGSAFSQARKLLGDLAVRKIFEFDAARIFVPPGRKLLTRWAAWVSRWNVTSIRRLSAGFPGICLPVLLSSH
jgi:hypothetical protein